jgi:tRNA 2-thiouridine synthesizing protein C
MAKKFLFISTRSPWQGTHAGACLDALMTHAIFDQEAYLYLSGDGVFQLVDHQDGAALGQKTMTRLFPALELYGIRGIFADAGSLAGRGLAPEDLMMDVVLADQDELGTLIRTCDQILVF